ncbi:MAG TPA: ROK family protein [Gaiellaceae bacterium]|nr:ROK family protein [Gaiellaceae bacterium]
MAKPITSGSPQLMRRLNAALVLRAIREHGSATRAGIQRATGLSKPTVREVVDVLIQTGYVSESLADGGAPRPGPRARLLSFRADLGHVLGIDIGANKILAFAADLSGKIVGSERSSTDGGKGAEIVLAAVRNAARQALEQARLGRSSVKAVAVGTPGIVDPRSGRITLAPQLVGWEGVRLAAALRRSFRCPVLVDNEVHLSVLAERWLGAAQGIDDAVYVQIGVGIGAGILIGGNVYRGSAGAAGEIGYLPIPDGDPPPATGLGHFEHAAGGSAFARLGREVADEPGGAVLRELAGGDPTTVDAEVVFRAAERGDEAAQRLLDELLDRLSRGLASVAAVLNPATVIIGGGLSRAGEALLVPLQRRVAELVPLPPRLVLSSLGDEAVALGAVRLATQTVDERLFAVEQAAI